MQKVSKQSLAMIALSILLAISIALTFTFAALSAANTATGNVTLSGTVSVNWSLESASDIVEIKDTGAAVITLSDKNFDFTLNNDKTEGSLNDAAWTELARLKVTITNGASSPLNWAVTVTKDNEKITLLSPSTANEDCKGTLDGKNTKTAVVAFTQLINGLTIKDVDAFGTEEQTFEITATISPKDKN